MQGAKHGEVADENTGGGKGIDEAPLRFVEGGIR